MNIGTMPINFDIKYVMLLSLGIIQKDLQVMSNQMFFNNIEKQIFSFQS